MALSYKNLHFYPQALSTGVVSRLNKDSDNAILISSVPQERSAKRNAQQINYAEFDNGFEDFDAEEEYALPKNLATPSAVNTAPVPKHLLKPARLTRLIETFEDETNDLVSQCTGESLVPIKLSIDYNAGGTKLVDHFMWNTADLSVTPEQFAQTLCTDLDLPSSVQPDIVDSITKQLEDFNYGAPVAMPDGEFHAIIDLSVNLNKKLYEDKIEWDLKQTEVTPEDFAEGVVADMGLPLEFRSAIAHGLHEATLRLKKEIADGVHNYELNKYQQLAGLIFEKNVRIRTDNSEHHGNFTWEPLIEILSPWEIEKREIERERNTRRLKRESARREGDDHGAKRRALSRRKDDSNP